MVRVVVAGSRDLFDYALVERAIKESGFKPTEVLSGGASGVDALGERWAAAHHIPVVQFPANWAAHGLAAGPLRNAQMAEACDAAIVVMWRTGSRGSEDMVRQMAKFPSKPVHVVRVPRASHRRRR
jgi:hypothetical protein